MHTRPRHRGDSRQPLSAHALHHSYLKPGGIPCCHAGMYPGAQLPADAAGGPPCRATQLPPAALASPLPSCTRSKCGPPSPGTCSSCRAGGGRGAGTRGEGLLAWPWLGRHVRCNAGDVGSGAARMDPARAQPARLLSLPKSGPRTEHPCSAQLQLRFVQIADIQGSKSSFSSVTNRSGFSSSSGSEPV